MFGAFGEGRRVSFIFAVLTANQQRSPPATTCAVSEDHRRAHTHAGCTNLKSPCSSADERRPVGDEAADRGPIVDAVNDGGGEC